VDTIPQKELRNNVSDVLRRVEAGETLTVTVSGRPAAQLTPLRPRQWVSGKPLHAIWASPAPVGMADDLKRFPAGLEDPFAA
jgi:prevent-host-death family protein